MVDSVMRLVLYAVSVPIMISNAERRARLSVRHRLIRDEWTDDVSQVADDMVALHSSDPVSVYLSAAARMLEPSVARIDDALYQDRSIIRHHGMRRTLWVVSREMLPVVHASCSADVAGKERRRLIQLIEAGGSIDAAQSWVDVGVDAIVEEISKKGALTTREIGAALPHLSVPITLAAGTSYSATVRAHGKLAALAAFQGRLVRTKPRGSWVSSEYAWEPLEIEPLDAQEAAGELIHRWLRRFGPGTELDLRWWTGWTATKTRQALGDAGAQLASLESGEEGWVARDDVALGTEDSWVALLPGLDPSTMGWKQRSWYLSDAVAERVFDRNGNAGPTVWVDGHVVGGWVQRADGTIALDVPDDVLRARGDEIDECVDRLAAVIGDTRFRVRFPSPNQRELLASQI